MGSELITPEFFLELRRRCDQEAESNGGQLTRQAYERIHRSLLRRKPGPKEDANIRDAAREYAAGASWEELYHKYLPDYDGLHPFTRECAEASFSRKVRRYAKNRPNLRSQLEPWHDRGDKSSRSDSAPQRQGAIRHRKKQPRTAAPRSPD